MDDLMFRMTAGAVILSWPVVAWAISFGQVPRGIAFLSVFGACLLLGLILDATKPPVPPQ